MSNGGKTLSWIVFSAGPAASWAGTNAGDTAAWVATSLGATNSFLAGLDATLVSALEKLYNADSADDLAQDIIGDSTEFTSFVAANSEDLTVVNALTQTILAFPTSFANYFQPATNGVSADATLAEDLASVINANPDSFTSYFKGSGNDATLIDDLGSAILGDPNDFASYFQNTSNDSTLVDDLTSTILADPKDFAAYFQSLSNDATLFDDLSNAITGDPNDFFTYFQSNDATLVDDLGNAITGDSQDFSSYFLGNDTTLIDDLANVITANAGSFSEYFQGSTNGTSNDATLIADLGSAILGDPNDFASYFQSTSNDSTLVDDLTSAILNDPIDFASYFQGSDANLLTDLTNVITANPGSFSNFFQNGDPNLLNELTNAILGDASDFSAFFASDTTDLTNAIQAEPFDFGQFLTSNPQLLDNFLGALTPDQAQMFFTGAYLNFFRTSADLAGDGNEAMGGILGSYQIANGFFNESLTATDLALANTLEADGVALSGYALNVTLAGGDNVVVGGAFGNFATNGNGNNRFVIEAPNLLGLPAGAANASSASFTGGSGANTYTFVGGGNNLGSITLADPAAGSDTLDFSNLSTPINLDLADSDAQNVAPGLALALANPSNVTRVIASPAANNAIVHAGANVLIQDGTNPNANPFAVDPVAAAPAPVQWVWLDFQDPHIEPGESLSAFDQSQAFNDGEVSDGDYAVSDQHTILHALENIYAAFSNIVQFTLIQPNTNVPGSPQAPLGYITVDYDDTPIVDGQYQPGGLSSEIDFGNLNLNTTVYVDMNSFLGNRSTQVPDTEADFVNLSIAVTAHEVGHTMGLEHQDSFGPVSFGITDPPGLSAYLPAYAGTVGAFETFNDVMSSPAAVGTTVQSTAAGLESLGERDAITLAFISDGTTIGAPGVDGPALDGMPTPTVPASLAQPDPVPALSGIEAQPVSLYTLNVPNPITTGYDAGKTFAVSAVDIDGDIGVGPALTQEVDGNPETVYETDLNGNQILDANGNPIPVTPAIPNYYTFQGQTGQVMAFQVMSSLITSIKDPVDTVLTLYGPDGSVIAAASNDDIFESSDSAAFDVTLPSTGTYTVKVASFSQNVSEFLNPTSNEYDPSAYYDTEHGHYELFMYTFSAYNVLSTATPSATMTAVSSSATGNTSVYGQSVMFTATVTSGGNSVTEGSVTFLDGNTVLASDVSLDSAGQASFSISTLDVASTPYTITADYNNTPDFDPSSGTATLTITPKALTASITAADRFYDGTASATISIYALDGVVGTDRVSVDPSGVTASFDDKDAGTDKTVTATGIALTGTDAGNYTVNSVATTNATIKPFTLTVTADAQDKVYDGTTAATVTLSDNRFAGDAFTDSDSSATFADPNQGTGKVVTVSGIAISGTDAGNYTLASTSATATADISADATATSVSSSVNPSAYGQSVTFMATVAITSPNGASTATGSIQFTIDGTPYGNPVKLSNGTASIADAELSAGLHAVGAQYTPDVSNCTGSNGALAVSQSVSSDATNTKVVSSVDPSAYGQSVTLTATVTNVSANGVGTPYGSVQFVIDNNNYEAAVPLSGGTASVSDPALSVGSHTVSVIYLPADGNFVTSNGTLSDGQTVNADATQTTISSSVNASTYGQTVSFTATVANTSGQTTGTPTGQVQFQIDGQNFGSPVALTSGSATSSGINSLSAGGHTITALYLGTGSTPAIFATSQKSLTQTVNKATITVTATSFNVNHGAALPTLSYNFSGFVLTDTSSVITGTPVLSTNGITSAAGIYPISVGVSGLSANNYNFVGVSGSLTVHPTVLNVFAHWGTQKMSLLGLTRDLPFINIASIEVVFSDSVSVSSSQLSLTGIDTQNYNVGTVNTPSPATTQDATWTLPAALGADRLMLSFLTGVLAPTPTGSVSLAPFSMNFNVLPGDVNGDGVVSVTDATTVRNDMPANNGNVYVVWADVNGDGTVDLTDYTLVSNKRNTKLP